jgi:hypothetical protein
MKKTRNAVTRVHMVSMATLVLSIGGALSWAARIAGRPRSARSKSTGASLFDKFVSLLF